MSQPSEANSKPNNVNNKTKMVIAISAAVVVIVIAVCVTVFAMSRGKEAETSGLTYASNVAVITDEESLQAAADAASQNAQNGRIALSYRNDAYSTDGKTFSCYIGNSKRNLFDMFLTIYADADFTDQVFLSELVRPGSVFEEITLDRALDPGDHTMYVALTQVDTDEDGTQFIVNQVVHTVEFHVSE